MSWEFPRLCRGGSNSLTIPAVAPHASTDETLNLARQAHEGELLGLKKEIMPLGFSHDRAEYTELAMPSECAIVPRVPPLGGSHHWGRVAPPIAALSGSPPKAPGSAGGYLLYTPFTS